MGRPTRRVVEILRRTAGGAVMVRGGDRLEYTYETGETIRDDRGYPLRTAAFCRFVREGWLLPGPDVGIWRSRELTDPPLIGEAKADMTQQRPTPQQTAILRRVATHRLMATFIDGRKQYSYGDGVPVKRNDAERLIHNRWVVPESPGLFRDEEPQTYVSRSP